MMRTPPQQQTSYHKQNSNLEIDMYVYPSASIYPSPYRLPKSRELILHSSKGSINMISLGSREGGGGEIAHNKRDELVFSRTVGGRALKYLLGVSPPPPPSKEW